MNYNNECNFPFAATAKGINISSGYRCPELNKAVGGSSTSAHRYGYAFDLVPTNGQMRAFKRFCRDFLAGRAFDRGQYLSMIHGKYYPMTD